MQKIKEFLNKKANNKHFIVVGSILAIIFLVTELIYLKIGHIIYVCISLTSLLFLFLLILIYLIKNHRKELIYWAYAFIMILSLLTLQGMVAKLMYKYTNIDTSVWLNSISGMVSTLIGAGIAGCISYFIVLKQIKYSKEALEKQIESSNESLEKQIEENKQLTRYTLEEAKNEKDKQNNNAALNYIYILNTEMVLHRDLFISYIYYKVHSNFVPSVLDDISKSLNSKKWDKIFVECARCFSNKLMIGLSGYYYGIERLKELELDDNQKKDAIKGQLISMYNCINIAELEFNENLRKQDVYYFDGKKVTVDKKTGELIIK